MALRLFSTATSVLVLIAVPGLSCAQTAAPAAGSAPGYGGRSAAARSVSGYGARTNGYAAGADPYAGNPAAAGAGGGGDDRQAVPDAVTSAPFTSIRPKPRFKKDSAGHTWSWDESLGVWRDLTTNATRYMEPH